MEGDFDYIFERYKHGNPKQPEKKREPKEKLIPILSAAMILFGLYTILTVFTHDITVVSDVSTIIRDVEDRIETVESRTGAVSLVSAREVLEYSTNLLYTAYMIMLIKLTFAVAKIVLGIKLMDRNVRSMHGIIILAAVEIVSFSLLGAVAVGANPLELPDLAMAGLFYSVVIPVLLMKKKELF